MGAFFRCDIPGEIDNKLRYFKPENVVGDGNCLFRSLVQSPTFPMSDHNELRHELTEWMHSEVMKESWQAQILKEDFDLHNRSSNYNLENHITSMQKAGFWGTDTELLAFTLRFGIQIVTVLNSISL